MAGSPLVTANTSLFLPEIPQNLAPEMAVLALRVLPSGNALDDVSDAIDADGQSPMLGRMRRATSLRFAARFKPGIAGAARDLYPPARAGFERCAMRLAPMTPGVAGRVGPCSRLADPHLVLALQADDGDVVSAGVQ